MTGHDDINGLIEFAFADSVWISKQTRAHLTEKYPEHLITLLDAILHDSTWPAEPWTSSDSLSEAAKLVEPELRKKYPQLTDASISKVLNYACFSWK